MTLEVRVPIEFYKMGEAFSWKRLHPSHVAEIEVGGIV